jgi:hypothetical protein
MAPRSVKFDRTRLHLFNYAKGYDANWPDPNEPLMPQ